MEYSQLLSPTPGDIIINWLSLIPLINRLYLSHTLPLLLFWTHTYHLDQIRIRNIRFYFITIYSFSKILPFFMHIKVSNLQHFSSAWRTTFNISFRIYLLMMNSLFFFFFKECFISSYWRIYFLDIEFHIGVSCFSFLFCFNTLNVSLHIFYLHIL